MEVWELAIREQVRDTIAEYTHAGDRGRVAELAALFTPDGTLEVKRLWTATGRTEIAKKLGSRAEGSAATAPAFTRHMVSNISFEKLTPESAQAASYFVVFTERGADHWGRYRDLLVPGDGRWQFAHRTVRVDATAPGSWLAALASTSVGP